MIIAKTLTAFAVLALAAAGFGALDAGNAHRYTIVDAGGCDTAALCP